VQSVTEQLILHVTRAITKQIISVTNAQPMQHVQQQVLLVKKDIIQRTMPVTNVKLDIIVNKFHFNNKKGVGFPADLFL
jgi:hypothetical protein